MPARRVPARRKSARRVSARRRLVLLLAALTCGVLLLDLARPSWTAPLRLAAATVLGPVQTTVAGWGDDEVAALIQDRNELAARVAQLEAEADLRADLGALQRSATWGEHELLPARVVGFSSGSAPVASRTVTIDVGAADGVRGDETVVNADGIVGRVLRVAPQTSDVAVLGDAEVVVGVRFGPGGSLGTVRSQHPPGLPARAPGLLTLTALGDSQIRVGDVVTTLGSADQVPYAARVPLGEVVSVDPGTGQLGRTAVVRPFADVDSLDLVAVLFEEPG